MQQTMSMPSSPALRVLIGMPSWCTILDSPVLGVMIEMVHCFHDCLAMSVLMHMQREDTD